MLRIAVLLSGSGTTLQNLMDQQRLGQLPIEIVQVISSRRNAFGIERAKMANLPVQVCLKEKNQDVSQYSEVLFQHCRDAQAELVCLAGFLQLLQIPADFEQRVLNIHPSLLPAFGGHGMYGHHVHAAVIASGAKISGCTVHFANNEYDQGPIMVQRSCPVLDADTPETLAKRVYVQECEAYPEAIRWYARGDWQIVGKRVICPSSLG